MNKDKGRWQWRSDKGKLLLEPWMRNPGAADVAKGAKKRTLLRELANPWSQLAVAVPVTGTLTPKCQSKSARSAGAITPKLQKS